MPDMPNRSFAADAILIEGVQIPAALGVTEAERAMRRPVRIDLEVGYPLEAAGSSDEVGDTIDYAEILRVLEEVVTGQEHRLVEAMGERVAAALFVAFEIDWLTIHVRKLNPLGAVLEHTGVRLTRRRPE